MSVPKAQVDVPYGENRETGEATSPLFQGIGKDVPRAQRTPLWEIPI